jgi:transposase InsO family protein
MQSQATQSTSKRNRYTTHQRTQALADAETLGTCAAARKHGLPDSTLSRWRTEERNAKAPASKPATSNPETSKPETSKPVTSKPATSKPATSKPLATQAEDKPAKRKVAKHYTPSQKAEVVEYAHMHGATKASKQFGPSRFSIYAWMREAEAVAKGEAPSKPTPTTTEEQRDAEILEEYSRHPGLGPSQIKNQLRRKNIKVSIQTVRRVMEVAGYRTPKVERTKHDKRFEAVRPNHLWHLDFVQRYINKASVFTLILLDDHSRFVVGHGVDDAERADMVISTFEAAVARHGKPEMIMHDRGAAFWSWRGISRFTALLAELGVDQIVAEDKEHNGKVENFNGNLHKELFDKNRFYDVGQMTRRLATHLSWYNHARTHHGLGGLLVPADRYYGRADEVLARIEAGAGKDEDPLAFGERRLSLFSITSQNGEIEVSLMGQRLPLGLSSPR